MLAPHGESKRARALWGTARARVQNLVVGVTKGFEKKLEINGVGYKAAIAGKNLQLSLGFSHDVVYPIPAGVAIATPKPTEITIAGIDKQSGRPDRGRDPRVPRPRALQGQGRQVRQRVHLPQGRQEEVRGAVMAKDPTSPTDRRKARVRRAIAAQRADGRPRLSRVPLVQADLRPDHRRREGRDAGRRLVAGEGAARGAEDRRERRGGQAHRQADRRARQEGGRRRRSCSIAAATCITGASRRSPRARARAASNSDLNPLSERRLDGERRDK